MVSMDSKKLLGYEVDTSKLEILKGHLAVLSGLVKHEVSPQPTLFPLLLLYARNQNPVGAFRGTPGEHSVRSEPGQTTHCKLNVYYAAGRQHEPSDLSQASNEGSGEPAVTGEENGGAVFTPPPFSVSDLQSDEPFEGVSAGPAGKGILSWLRALLNA